MRHHSLLTALFFFCLAQASAQHIVLTCDKPVILYNNSVGHEWRFGFGVNKTFYPIIDPVLAPVASAASLEFIIQEMDKYTDQATQSLEIDPSSMEYNKQYSKKLEITVTENGGRYKGNTAKFSVTVFYKKVATRV
jgi:hypothetical protein